VTKKVERSKIMKPEYATYYFNLSSMCPPLGGDMVARAIFISGIKKLADSMTRCLPEYYVEVQAWEDDVKLLFRRVEPHEEE
jgi:hypothetical protein